MTRLYSDPDFDPRIADWLEGLVDRAPGTTLPAVTAAVPLITQRQPSRLPWRNPTMTRFALLGAAAALVAAVGITGLALTSRGPAPNVGGPSPSPSATEPAASKSASPSPSPTEISYDTVIPAMTERTTPRPDGVSIGYPAGWVEEDNGVRWWLNGVPDSSELVGFSVDSSNLEPSETAADWIADRAADESEGIGMTCPVSRGPTEITIAGSRGLLLSNGCSITSGERRHFLAVLVADDRGYSFHMDIRLKQNGRVWFDALLANVELGPAASLAP